MKEKRAHIRYPGEALEYQCRIDGLDCRNICRDISLGGVRIPETVSRGSILSLHFSLDRELWSIEVECVRSAEKNSSLRFINNNPSSAKTLNRLEGFIQAARIAQEYDFQYLLKNISPANKKHISHVFSTFLKILFIKQHVLKRPILSQKDVNDAFCLCVDYLLKSQPVTVEGNLGDLLQRNPSAGEVFNYYQKKVKGEVQDVFGRTLILGDEVLHSLFKDPATGDKIQRLENFVFSRAKRIPWIKYVLTKTKQIYVVQEIDWITYYYTMPFTLKFIDKETGQLRTVTDHYLIVTKKKKGEEIKFVTAYVPESRLDLFKKICRGSCFLG